MPKYEIITIDSNSIVVKELNSSVNIRLSIIQNKGSENVTFYDEKETIWDFEGSPFPISVLKEGDYLELETIIPNNEQA